MPPMQKIGIALFLASLAMAFWCIFKRDVKCLAINAAVMAILVIGLATF